VGRKFYVVSSELQFFGVESTFRKPYRTIQNNEHVYMAFRVIKQGNKENVEVYYEQIFKLANYLQHKANESLLTTLF
jgi:hypothetical protein